jgi:hypothetical protein
MFARRNLVVTEALLLLPQKGDLHSGFSSAFLVFQPRKYPLIWRARKAPKTSIQSASDCGGELRAWLEVPRTGDGVNGPLHL